MQLSIPFKTYEHAQLEALLPRLEATIPQYLQLRERYESSMRWHLRLCYLHQHLKQNIITSPVFYGLTLYHQEHLVTFDGLVLTPYVIFLLETTPVADHMLAETDGSLVVENSQNITRSGAEKKQFLKVFLQELDLPVIPIHSLTIFTNYRVKFDENKNHPDIIPLNQLFYRLASLIERYDYASLSPSQFERLTKLLTKQHYIDFKHLIEIYQIPDGSIKKGVWCPGCKEDMMIRAQGYWLCNSCRKRSRDAHLQTLKEFALLYRATITNREARYFLKMDSPQLTARLLAEAKLEQLGQARSRAYRLHHLLKNERKEEGDGNRT